MMQEARSLLACEFVCTFSYMNNEAFIRVEAQHTKERVWTEMSTVMVADGECKNLSDKKVFKSMV